ncbi:Uncharacterised protein [Vibrio cholerae]|nr:Uncharacterised protein [Vibrio cholerae]
MVKRINKMADLILRFVPNIDDFTFSRLTHLFRN